MVSCVFLGVKHIVFPENHKMLPFVPSWSEVCHCLVIINVNSKLSL